MNRTCAAKECARWLAYCLSIGWAREALDRLEELWWEFPHGRAAMSGFGLALPMLDARAPAKHPWLTSAVIEQENAVDEYQQDVCRVFEDSAREVGER